MSIKILAKIEKIDFEIAFFPWKWNEIKKTYRWYKQKEGALRQNASNKEKNGKDVGCSTLKKGEISRRIAKFWHEKDK